MDNRVMFIRHAAVLIYAADFAQAVDRAHKNGRPVEPMLPIVSDRAVKSAVVLADALDAAGFSEAAQ